MRIFHNNLLRRYKARYVVAFSCLLFVLSLLFFSDAFAAAKKPSVVTNVSSAAACPEKYKGQECDDGKVVCGGTCINPSSAPARPSGAPDGTLLSCISCAWNYAPVQQTPVEIAKNCTPAQYHVVRDTGCLNGIQTISYAKNDGAQCSGSDYNDTKPCGCPASTYDAPPTDDCRRLSSPTIIHHTLNIVKREVCHVPADPASIDSANTCAACSDADYDCSGETYVPAQCSFKGGETQRKECPRRAISNCVGPATKQFTNVCPTCTADVWTCTDWTGTCNGTTQGQARVCTLTPANTCTTPPTTPKPLETQTCNNYAPPTIQKGIDGGTLPSGSSGQTLYYRVNASDATKNAWTATSNLYNTGNAVGIESGLATAATPTSVLHLMGALDSAHKYGTDLSIDASANGIGGHQWILWSTGSDAAEGAGKFLIKDQTAASSPVRLTIDTNGNVGIGTTDPSVPLQINNPTAAYLAFSATTPASNVNFSIGANGSEVTTDNVTTGVNRAEINVQSAHDLAFFTSGALRALLTREGSFYLGSGGDIPSVPSQLLVQTKPIKGVGLIVSDTVSDTSRVFTGSGGAFTGTNKPVGNDYIFIPATQGFYKVVSSATEGQVTVVHVSGAATPISANSVYYIYKQGNIFRVDRNIPNVSDTDFNTTPDLIVDNTGIVSIGASPSASDSDAKLYVNGKVRSTEGYCLGSTCVSNWDDIGIWAKAGANIYAKNLGNVGIGTMAPGYALDIQRESMPIVSVGTPSGSASKVWTGLRVMRATTEKWFIGLMDAANDATGGMLVFRRNGGTNSATNDMAIDANGNIGMGTTDTRGARLAVTENAATQGNGMFVYMKGGKTYMSTTPCASCGTGGSSGAVPGTQGGTTPGPVVADLSQTPPAGESLRNAISAQVKPVQQPAVAARDTYATSWGVSSQSGVAVTMPVYQVDLNWNAWAARLSGVQNYTIQRATGTGQTSITLATQSSSSYSDTSSVQEGAQYTYVVLAQMDSGVRQQATIQVAIPTAASPYERSIQSAGNSRFADGGVASSVVASFSGDGTIEPEPMQPPATPAPVVAPMPPAQTTYLSNLGAWSGTYPEWHSSWALPVAGSGIVRATVSANNPLIAFSTSQNIVGQPMYEITLGAWGTTTLVSKGTGLSRWGHNYFGGDQVLKNEVSMPNPGQVQLEITVDAASERIAIKFGGVVMAEYTDPNFIKDIKYFSFSDAGRPITFSNISVSPLPTSALAPTPATAPIPASISYSLAPIAPPTIAFTPGAAPVEPTTGAAAGFTYRKMQSITGSVQQKTTMYSSPSQAASALGFSSYMNRCSCDSNYTLEECKGASDQFTTASDAGSVCYDWYSQDLTLPNVQYYAGKYQKQ